MLLLPESLLTRSQSTGMRLLSTRLGIGLLRGRDWMGAQGGRPAGRDADHEPGLPGRLRLYHVRTICLFVVHPSLGCRPGERGRAQRGGIFGIGLDLERNDQDDDDEQQQQRWWSSYDKDRARQY